MLRFCTCYCGIMETPSSKLHCPNHLTTDYCAINLSLAKHKPAPSLSKACPNTNQCHYQLKPVQTPASSIINSSLSKHQTNTTINSSLSKHQPAPSSTQACPNTKPIPSSTQDCPNTNQHQHQVNPVQTPTNTTINSSSSKHKQIYLPLYHKLDKSINADVDYCSNLF